MAGGQIRVRMVSLDLDLGPLVRPGGEIYRRIEHGAGVCRDRAKMNLTNSRRIDTGRLRNSIRYEISVTGMVMTARVLTDVTYAGFIHDGTANNGAGYIYPRRALVLRFKAKGSGAVVFAPRVRGIKGTPFLQDARDSLTEDDFA